MTLQRRMLLLAALFAGAARAAPSGALVLPAPGDVPADVLFAAAFADLDHAPMKLARGRPTIVNFWARWCGPCKVEIPELQALHQRRVGVEVVGIALEDDGAAVRDFARAYEMSYPLLLARQGSGLDLMRALGNPQAGLPFTLALDRRGEVAALRLGLLSRELLDAAVQRALR